MDKRKLELIESWRKWKRDNKHGYDTFRKWSVRQLKKLKVQSLQENTSIDWDTMRVF